MPKGPPSPAFSVTATDSTRPQSGQATAALAGWVTAAAALGLAAAKRAWASAKALSYSALASRRHCKRALEPVSSLHKALSLV